MRIALLIMILFGFISCKNNSKDHKNIDKGSVIESLNNNDSSTPIIGYITKSIGSSNDFYDVTKKCALLLQLPDEISDSLSNNEGLDELSDDENSASMNAYELLQKASIMTEETPKRFIRYINNGDTLIIDTRKKKDKLFGYYIFFNADKKPKLFDCGMIDEHAINEYFKK